MHSKLRQSVYLDYSSGNETICIPVDSKKSADEKESFAWDTLNTIVHEAALSFALGQRVRKDISKTLMEKILALCANPNVTK
jgi:hypothetical protein